jgi:hypothetical protein
MHFLVSTFTSWPINSFPSKYLLMWLNFLMEAAFPDSRLRGGSQNEKYVQSSLLKFWGQNTLPIFSARLLFFFFNSFSSKYCKFSELIIWGPKTCKNNKNRAAESSYLGLLCHLKTRFWVLVIRQFMGCRIHIQSCCGHEHISYYGNQGETLYTRSLMMPTLVGLKADPA